ncbi:hypothetical protein ACFLS4_04835 [Bacteroidota bacterium]
MKTKFFLTVLIVFIGNSIFSQTAFKETIKEYDDVCFCSVGLEHPRSILNLDNNLEILFSLKEGKTLNELDKMGVKYSNSQILLLKSSGLIKKVDSIYQPVIPILSKEETTLLREKTKEIAKEIIPHIENDYKLFCKVLNEKKLHGSNYSIFFAFALDGLVWNILRQNNCMQKLNITQENPFWDGTFWMIAPKRNFSCGTNSLSSGNYIIVENWSDITTVYVSNYKLFKEILNDYKENGIVTKPEIFNEFRKNKFFNDKGELQIPIIKADSTDMIFVQSEIIAKKVADYLINNIDYSSFLSDHSNLSKEQKIIILYHEIMWDILDIMEETRQIKKPIAFGNPKESKAKDLKDLIFIIEN